MSAFVFQHRRFSLLAAVTAWLAVSGVTATLQAPPVAIIQEERGAKASGVSVAPTSVAEVSFADLALIEEQLQPASEASQTVAGVVVERGEYEEPEYEGLEVPADPTATPTQAPHDVVPGPNVASPSPAASFLGLDDIPKVGTGTSVIPPDTEGAVGPDRVLTTLNNNYRVLDKVTGAVISTVSINTFWASVAGASGPFDPKTVYDPFNNRFLVSAVSNAASTSSKILLGISSTSDPNGTWTLFGFPACTAGAPCGAGGAEWWADYPELGFNMNWAAVSVNMFSTSGSLFQQSRVLVVNYPELRSGASPGSTMFHGILDFTVVPVVTYSSSEATLYAPNHNSSVGRSYRLNTITGTAAAPVYTQGALKTHTLVSSWVQPGGDILPQASEPGTGLVQGVDSGDSRIMNAIFRNNAIWYAQTVGLPQGGPLTHTAAQWIKLDTSGNDSDAGRVEDSTATSTNGGKWYAYPSISVNANDDALLGFSQFGSTIFPSAAYVFRASSDAAGTMRDVAIAQAGGGFYYKTFSGTRNRWGDYSATQVDPTDDMSLWTLQEFSKAQVGTGNGSGRWGTWWVKVAPATAAAPTISSIANQTTNEDTSTGAISFTVGDADTPVGTLVMSGTSSNTTLVPNSNITFGGSQASRTVILTPAFNQSGTTTISLTVSDGALTANTTFMLTVNAANDPPTISAIPVTTISRNTAVTVSFVVGDAESGASSVTASGVSSNTSLVPNGNLVFGGSGASRTLMLTPAADQLGATTITVMVSDGSLTASASFLLTVTGALPLLDLNSDGSGDAFLYNVATGAWQFEVTNQLATGFTESASTWDAGWQVYPANLNDDAYTDIFLYDPVRGLWVQARNNAGDVTFTYTVGNWDRNWQIYPADLDGNGLTDLFVYNAANGVWVKCFVDGSGDFAGYTVGQWDPGWTFSTTDLNGDGRDDFFLYNRSNGVWVEAFSQAGVGSFDYPASGRWDLGWQMYPADLNGDGRTDLFLYNAAGVHVSALSRLNGDFDYPVVGQWDAGWTINPGDLNNDNRTDLFLYNATTGVWVEAFSNGAGDFTYAVGNWDPGWTVRVTDLNNDGRADVLVSRADGTWVQAVNVGDGMFSETAGNWGTGWMMFTQ